jgi:exopolysaccharide biosynthesis polyprenyl glycosylphosphotransferase
MGETWSGGSAGRPGSEVPEWGRLTVTEADTTPAAVERKTRWLAHVKRQWLQRLGLVVSDIVLINAAFAIAYWIRYELEWLWAIDPAYFVSYTVFLPFTLILTVLLLLFYRREGLYQVERRGSWFDEVYGIVNGTTTGIVVMVVLVFISSPSFYSRVIFFYAGALIIVLLSMSRLTRSLRLRSLHRRGIGVVRAIIVGAGEVGRAVMRTIVAHPELGYSIVGFVDDDPAKGSTDIGRFRALGGLDKLASLIQDREVDEVIITLPWQYHRKIMSIMTQCQRENVQARVVPDLFQMTVGRMSITTMAGIPLIGIKTPGAFSFQRVIKRIVDVALALVVLIVLSPLMALIALVIKLDSPGPVLFGQERVGKGGRLFTLYKFRSMAPDAEAQKDMLAEMNEADGPLFKIRCDPRCTRVGRLLRRFSLDELPQFYNVLRGDMSLIGPRPALASEVEKYQPWHRRRLEVAPGITGLWQVSGRSDLPFDEMALLDIYYVEQWSPALDVKILLRTVPTVLFGDGAY